MATRTSVKSGNWNDTTVWSGGVVPANGDAFVIDSAHEVVFNVDQSGMAAGMADSTIKGILRFSTVVSTFLKMNANLSLVAADLGGGNYSPALLYVGNSRADPIPRTITATIQFPGTNTYFNGNGNRAMFFGWAPQHSYTTAASPAVTGANQIVLTEDMELLPGEKIAIAATGAPLRPTVDWNAEPVTWYFENDHRMITGVKGLHTVASYDATTKTVTLVEPLEHDRAVGDLVARITRQIIIQRPVRWAYQISSLLNGHWEGVLFKYTRGPSSHQGYGWMSDAGAGIEAGCFHCTAYNSLEGGLGYNPSRILIEDSVVYTDELPPDLNGIYGVIHYRDIYPSVYGHINRVACINTTGYLTMGSKGSEWNDVVTQNTGGRSGFYDLANGVVRRWDEKSPVEQSLGIDLENCHFIDCTYNARYDAASRSRVLNYCHNINRKPGASAVLSKGGIFFYQEDAMPKILHGESYYEAGRLWNDYHIYFKAGVPVTFTVPVRVLDDHMQARIMIIDPMNDPEALGDLFDAKYSPVFSAWQSAGSDTNNYPPMDSTNKIGHITESLAEAILPEGVINKWTDLTVTYTSQYDRELILRVMGNHWVNFAQWYWLPPWDNPGYTAPVGVRIEFDVTALEEQLGRVSLVPEDHKPNLHKVGEVNGGFTRR